MRARDRKQVSACAWGRTSLSPEARRPDRGIIGCQCIGNGCAAGRDRVGDGRDRDAREGVIRSHRRWRAVRRGQRWHCAARSTGSRRLQAFRPRQAMMWREREWRSRGTELQGEASAGVHHRRTRACTVEMISSEEIPWRYVPVVERCECPSWRWIRGSGIPSCSSSTACACLS
jgi:hypothetical protein